MGLPELLKPLVSTAFPASITTVIIVVIHRGQFAATKIIFKSMGVVAASRRRQAAVQMRWSGGSRGPCAGGRCGRDDSSSGGVAGSFRTGDDLFVRRNRGCVVLLVTLRITCACGRGPARHVCAAAGPVVAGCRIRCARPAVGRSRLAALASGEACRIRGWAAGRVPCSAWPRPDAARGPGVVSADSCGPGAA